MKFRPRYSLLTLLVVTALVAGGVKLWYGPHHVIERTSPDFEDEYTYTRDWRGDKIVHGPRVLRYFRKDDTPQRVEIRYYLQGVKTEHEQEIVALSEGEGWHSGYISSKPPALPPVDQAIFQDSIQLESAKLKEQGFQPGLSLYQYFEDIDPHDTDDTLQFSTAK